MSQFFFSDNDGCFGCLSVILGVFWLRSLFSGGSKSGTKQTPELASQNPKNMNSVPSEQVIKEIVTKMFPHYRIERNSERKTGFSQSRVYTVRRYNGRKEIPPAAVKIAPTYVIEKEKAAFDKYIYENLPHAAQLRDSVYADKNKWAGLHYELAGSGVRETKSLAGYLQENETELDDVKKTISLLLDYAGTLWKDLGTYQGFSLRSSYDRVLPVNLTVNHMRALPGKAISLSAQTTDYGQSTDIDVGSYVSLEGFEVFEVNPYEGASSVYEYILNHPESQNDLQSNSYRLQLRCETPYPPNYSIRKKAPLILGQVINTRADLLKAAVDAAFSNNAIELNLDNPTVLLEWSGDMKELPNPLNTYPQILDKKIDVRMANIHGDLQVENIQVDPKTGDVFLIDFADARNDHVLHDLLRLETSLVTKWLSKILQENELPASEIFPFYKQLHCATFHPTQFEPNHLPTVLEKPFVALQLIREAAANLLFDKRVYREYYDGLTIYLLGALKFKELQPFAHQVAFLGAATSQYLASSNR